MQMVNNNNTAFRFYSSTRKRIHVQCTCILFKVQWSSQVCTLSNKCQFLLFANCTDVQFSLKINCSQSCSYQIAYAVNNEGFFYGTHPGSLHITTLHGSLLLLGGLTPPDPPYFAHCWRTNLTGAMKLRYVFAL